MEESFVVLEPAMAPFVRYVIFAIQGGKSLLLLKKHEAERVDGFKK